VFQALTEGLGGAVVRMEVTGDASNRSFRPRRCRSSRSLSGSSARRSNPLGSAGDSPDFGKRGSETPGRRRSPSRVFAVTRRRPEIRTSGCILPRVVISSPFPYSDKIGNHPRVPSRIERLLMENTFVYTDIFINRRGKIRGLSMSSCKTRPTPITIGTRESRRNATGRTPHRGFSTRQEIIDIVSNYESISFDFGRRSCTGWSPTRPRL
jgi:hypothetical protein